MSVDALGEVSNILSFYYYCFIICVVVVVVIVRSSMYVLVMCVEVILHFAKVLIPHFVRSYL